MRSSLSRCGARPIATSEADAENQRNASEFRILGLTQNVYECKAN